MAKFTLELNSHSLSYYQQCEKLFKFKQVDLLDYKGEYYPFKRGTGMARFLALWYRARRRNYQGRRLERFEEKLFELMLKSQYFKNTRDSYDFRLKKIKHNVLDDDNLHIASRIMAYFKKYQNEKYPIIAVEQGFTKTLYEDKNTLFVYSGRPDLVLDYGEYGIGAMDHKSESRVNNIFKFNNQFLGYTWALLSENGPVAKRLTSHMGMINYIGLQKDSKDGDVLRRDTFNFTDRQIARWKSDTIEWYYRILHSIVNKKFTRSWNCDGKYGFCMFAPVCTSGSRKEELIKIGRDYSKLEKLYKSW